MAVAGACPGMVLPQVGTALPNSMFTVAGGLLGALAYGLLEPTLLRPALLARGKQCAGTGTPEDFLDVKLGRSFVPLTLALGVACGTFAIVLEVMSAICSTIVVSLDFVTAVLLTRFPPIIGSSEPAEEDSFTT